MLDLSRILIGIYLSISFHKGIQQLRMYQGLEFLLFVHVQKFQFLDNINYISDLQVFQLLKRKYFKSFLRYVLIYSLSIHQSGLHPCGPSTSHQISEMPKLGVHMTALSLQSMEKYRCHKRVFQVLGQLCWKWDQTLAQELKSRTDESVQVY